MCYVEKVYKILEESLQNNKDYSVDELFKRFLLEMPQEEFIRSVAGSGPAGYELAADLAKKFDIDLFSSIFLQKGALDASQTFEWFLKEELRKSVHFLESVDVPFGTILSLFQHESFEAWPKIISERPEVLKNLKEMIDNLKKEGSSTLARYFETLIVGGKELENVVDSEEEFFEQDDGGYIFESHEEREDPYQADPQNCKELVSLLVAGNAKEAKKKEREKIMTNVICPDIADPALNVSDFSDLLKDLKVSTKEHVSESLQREERESIGTERNSVILYKGEELARLVLDVNMTVEEMDNNLNKINVQPQEIKKVIIRIIEETLKSLKQPYLTQSQLKIFVKRNVEKAECLDKRYGRFQLQPSLSELSLISVLFEKCMENNISTYFKPKYYSDLEVLIRNLANRLIDYGFSR